MTTLTDIDRRIEQLKGQRARLAADNAKAARAKRTRQAVVLGAHLMARHPDLVKDLVRELTRAQDLELFLPAAPQT